MHPAFLDNMSWEMAEVYGAITDQILINLARHFPFYEYVDDLPRSVFAYQAKMLAQMGQVNKETIQIIRNGLADADLALQGVLEQAIIDSVKGSEPELIEAVKKGVFSMPTTITVSPNQMRAFELYYKQAADKLNLVNTVMLESTQSAYAQAVTSVVSELELADRMNRTQIALDAATGETITGVSSWNTALRHATDKLKDGGVIGFIDHAGRQWSAEAYVAMDIRTTVFNTGRAAVWETNEQFGNDLYLVSYHNGARPLCYPWQNKVISSMDTARVTYDLDGNEIQVIAQSDTSYGEAAGLFGINCKHYPTPFVPGVSLADGKPQDKEENDRVYAESQEQRRLERKLREEKRNLLMAKEQGRPQEEIDRLREKTRQSSQDIDDFCRETGRARHRDREAVYTKREFPDKERYDVSAFEHQQQDLIRDYYAKGGEQQAFTAGQMTPNQPIVPVQNVNSQVAQNTGNVVQSNGFVPAKSKQEAELYAQQHFATVVNYNGNVPLDTMNTVNRELTELTDKYPINKLTRIQNNNRMRTANARANGGILEFKSNNLTPSNYSLEGYHSTAKRTLEQINKMFPNGVPASLQKSYNAALEQLKFTRWSVSSQYGSINATIPHEYGHILADQYFGQINGKYFCKTADTAENIAKRKLVEDVFKKAKKTGDIYKISEYGKKDVYEFFAESFAAKWMGETLPDYIEEMLVNVLQ